MQCPSLLLLLALLAAMQQITAATPISMISTKTTISTASLCPLNLSYVSTLPWDPTSCQLHGTSTNTTDCCQTLLSLFGIALADRLRKTGKFRLPDIATAAACLQEFQYKLQDIVIADCFPSPQRFVIDEEYCAGIRTVEEWEGKIGVVAVEACDGDLSDLTRCSSCINAGFNVTSVLTAVDGDVSHSTQCFYLTVLYAAGVVNRFGPDDPRVATCIFGLAIKSPSSFSDSRLARHRRFAVAAYASVLAGFAFTLVVCSVFLVVRRVGKKRSCGEDRGSALEQHSRPHSRPNTGAMCFNIEEIKMATENFSPRNLIGRGGFGTVYRGSLQDGSLVAVKKLIEPPLESGNNEDFINEVEIISHLRHKNLVSLRGCCIKEYDMEEGRQRYLIYDYMPNGNLDDHIFNSKNENRESLRWPQRKNIILDVAKGLMYLHYGVKPAIYHRDIKTTNVLLDAEMRARVADFGLAKQSREGHSHLTTRVAGTYGYLAPEYALYGQLTEKSDVYSFGVLILEVMSSRRALDTSASSNLVLITDWAWTFAKTGRIDRVLDEALRIDDEWWPNSKGMMERFVLIGILCAHVMVALRPTISEALKMLDGDIGVPNIPDRPPPLNQISVFSDSSNSSISPNQNVHYSLNSRNMLR